MLSTVAVVDMMLDKDRLSALVGFPVRAVRMRVKPSTSVVVAIADQDTSSIVGWARILWPISHRKADKVENFAQQHGLKVERHMVDEGLLFQAGEVMSDPKCGRHCLHAREMGVLGDGAGDAILRYNPMRRLVVQVGDKVVRVMSKQSLWRRDVHRFIATAVAAPEYVDDGSTPWLSIQRFTGNMDLSHCRDHEATRSAGKAFAALHASTDSLPEALASHLAGRAADPRAQLEAHLKLLRELAPSLEEQGHKLASGIPVLSHQHVLSHGDASPDQVLFEETTGEIWLTDFDRACLAPPEADLGSYLSVVDDLTGEAFLDGYRQGGGIVPSSEELRNGQIRSMMLRIADPLRTASPSWREQIADNMRQLAEMIR